jgi:type IV pilus biogenesis protein CpaD/CtpE
VRAVIEESVAAHLKQSNFNNTDEIAHLLASVGVDIDKVNSSFPALQEFMERRHQIVHRADRQDIVVGSGDHRVRSLSRSAVQAWIQAVKQFGAEVFRELGP